MARCGACDRRVGHLFVPDPVGHLFAWYLRSALRYTANFANASLFRRAARKSRMITVLINAAK